MKLSYRLLLTAVVLPLLSIAQQSNRQHFPQQQKKISRQPAGRYLACSAGSSMPYNYSPQLAGKSGYFHPVSRPSYYFALMAHRPARYRWEWLAGLELTNSSQGMAFVYQQYGANARIRNYNNIVIGRLQVGAAYRFSPYLTVSAGPFVGIAGWVGSKQLLSGTTSDTPYGYTQVDYIEMHEKYKPRLQAGINVSADLQVYRRLGVRLLGSIDGRSSTPTTDRVAVNGECITVQNTPHLLHAGVAVSYRLGAQ